MKLRWPRINWRRDPEITTAQMIEEAIRQSHADTADELRILAATVDQQSGAILLEYAKLGGYGYVSAASPISRATGIRPQRVIVEVLQRYAGIAQSRAKLKLYQRNGLLHYDITTVPDACECCLAAAAAGPYLVEAPTAIPGLLGCDRCRCAIAPHIDD